MDEEQRYLEGLLAKYKIQEQDIQAMNKLRGKFKDIIQQQYKKEFNNFFNAGSQAKNTAIRSKYDLDLCIYFKENSFNIRELPLP